MSPRTKKLMGLGIAGFIAAGLVFTAIKAVWGNSLRIQSQPGGATVLVDGEEKGRTSSDGALQVSHLHGQIHTVTVKADGYVDYVRQIRFPVTAEVPLQVLLYPKPAELHIHGLPGSSVLLDNGLAGYTNYAGRWDFSGARTGTYSLSLRRPGYLEWTGTVTIKPGDNQTVQAHQAEAPPSPEQIAAKAEALVASARRRFGATDYVGARKDCEEALALQPDQGEAKQLLQQIANVENVLKGTQ